MALRNYYLHFPIIFEVLSVSLSIYDIFPLFSCLSSYVYLILSRILDPKSSYLLFIVVSGQIWDLQPIAMSNPSSPFSPVHTYKTSDGENPGFPKHCLTSFYCRNPRAGEIGKEQQESPQKANGRLTVYERKRKG